MATLRDDDRVVTRPEPPRERRSEGGAPWVAIIGALLLLALLALALWYFLGREGPAAPGAAAPANVTLDQLADNPSAYYGDTVTVSGEITDYIGLNAFLLGDAVLVVSRQPLTSIQGWPRELSMADEETAQVTGPVRAFDIEEVERLTSTDLDDRIFDLWEGQPSIVATSVQVVNS